MKTLLNDIRWLAGWLEGEGFFGLQTSSHGRRTKTPRFGAASTDKDVIERAAKIVGAHTLYDTGAPKGSNLKVIKSPLKKVWRISMTGWRAAQWMMTLYPLMGERRKAAIHAALSHWKENRQRLADGTSISKINRTYTPRVRNEDGTFAKKAGE